LIVSSDTDVFSNYSILANLDTTENDAGYLTKKDAIQDPLNHYSFELLSLNRWLEIKKIISTNFSLSIYNELEYINNHDLQKVVYNRELFTKYLFDFERFKLEFNEFVFKFNRNSPEFELVDEEKKYLFDNVTKRIKRNIIYMEEFINTLNRHSENTLALKNIEFSMNMQNYVLLLTIVVLVISFVQIFLTLSQMMLDHLTLKIITNYLIKYLL
jgi:hypothetical protein